MALTLNDLLGALLREYGGPYLETTATGGSTTTIVDTTNGPMYADDWWNNAWANIITTTDGLAPQGETRHVSDFAGSSGTWTVSAAFTATVGAGDTVRFWSGPPKAEALKAIEDALIDAFPAFYQVRLDTSLSIVADTYKYTLPATIGRLVRVELATDVTGAKFATLHDWRVIDDETVTGGVVTSTRSLVLSDAHSYTTGVTLRLTGISPIAMPAADTYQLPVPPQHEGNLRAFVALYGAAMLHERAITGDTLDQQRTHITRAQQLYPRAEVARGKSMPRIAGSVYQVYRTYGVRS